MQPEAFRALFDFSGADPIERPAGRVELFLRTADGRAWVLEMAAGCERFIGLYPRICGIENDKPLLEFRGAGTF